MIINKSIRFLVILALLYPLVISISDSKLNPDILNLLQIPSIKSEKGIEASDFMWGMSEVNPLESGKATSQFILDCIATQNYSKLINYLQKIKRTIPISYNSEDRELIFSKLEKLYTYNDFTPNYEPSILIGTNLFTLINIEKEYLKHISAETSHEKSITTIKRFTNFFSFKRILLKSELSLIDRLIVLMQIDMGLELFDSTLAKVKAESNEFLTLSKNPQFSELKISLTLPTDSDLIEKTLIFELKALKNMIENHPHIINYEYADKIPYYVPLLFIQKNRTLNKFWNYYTQKQADIPTLDTLINPWGDFSFYIRKNETQFDNPFRGHLILIEELKERIFSKLDP